MSNFKTAKADYIEARKLQPKTKKAKTKSKPESKYERAARLGLCFHCLYDKEDKIERIPRGKADGLCPVCMNQFRMGTERLS